MKTLLKTFLLFFSICFLTSCSSDVNIFEYVNKNSPIDIRILDSTANPLNRQHTQIQINSDKYSRLIKWADENKSGWQSTPASYIQADIIVSQGSFRLLYWVGKGNAVIAFTDKDNKSKQYSKSIKKGDLDFLTK